MVWAHNVEPIECPDCGTTVPNDIHKCPTCGAE